MLGLITHSFNHTLRILHCVLFFSVTMFSYSCRYQNHQSFPSERVPSLANFPKLAELCQTFQTDKCAEDHNFVEIYERWFSPIRHHVNKVFEIGILRGGSHLMWQAYFPQASIYGIDLEDCSWLEEKGIHTMIADQSNRDDLESYISQYGGSYDIIIDDGGHSMDQQQISFGYLFQYLKPGGLYIIEDVHTSLPEFYQWEGYNLDSDGGNTTLHMIEQYIRTSEVNSKYLTEEEKKYLHLHIESMNLVYRVNHLHSTLCVIQKR